MSNPRLATVALLVVLSLVGTRRFRTLVNPVVLVCAPWAGMLLGQEILASFFPFSATAALMVGLAAMAFTAGALVLSLHCRGALRPTALTLRLQARANRLWPVLSWGLIALAVANVATFLYYGYVLGVGRAEGGGGGLVFYILSDAIQSSSWGWIQRACQIAVYLGAALFAFDTVRRRRVGLRAGLFLGTVLAQGWFVANRLPVFLVVSIFALTWGLVFASRLRRPSLQVAGVAAVALILGGVFYWYTMARRHGGQLPAFALALDLATTFLGPPAGFSAHLQTTAGWRFGMLTGITIQGPLELLGLAHRGLGQFAPLAPVAELTLQTNVFSGLAMLLDEVGVVGTVALMIVLGSVTTALVASLYRRPSMPKAIVLLNLYLLLFWLPVVLLTYYVFWWMNLTVAVVLGSTVFAVRGVAPIVHEEIRCAG